MKKRIDLKKVESPKNTKKPASLKDKDEVYMSPSALVDDNDAMHPRNFMNFLY